MLSNILYESLSVAKMVKESTCNAGVSVRSLEFEKISGRCNHSVLIHFPGEVDRRARADYDPWGSSWTWLSDLSFCIMSILLERLYELFLKCILYFYQSLELTLMSKGESLARINSQQCWFVFYNIVLQKGLFGSFILETDTHGIMKEEPSLCY